MPDLVQKERPAVRLLESSAPHLLRAGERAALVAEELALEQLLGNGAAVDRQEAVIGASYNFV